MSMTDAEFAQTDRIIGTEMESSAVLDRDAISVLRPPDNWRQFRVNGSRLYLDVCEILEHASPECLGPKQGVLYDRAGDYMARDIVPAATPMHRRLISPGTPVGGNVSVLTAGHHENYLGLRSTPEQAVTDVLIAHGASRIAINGAGAILRSSNGKTTFYSVGQKVWGLNKEEGSGTTSNMKCLVNTREEPHANDRTWRRIHHTSGDANMSDYASWLTLATTSLCLRLAEAGVSVSDLKPVNSIKAGREWSSDPTLQTTVLIGPDQKKMTMVDVQEQLGLRCLDLSERVQLPDEEVEAIAEWLDVCDKLRKDPALLIGKLDWVTKLAVIRAKLGDGPTKKHNLEELKKLDRGYDLLERGYGERMKDLGKLASFFDRDEVKAATCTPPQTRAAKRSELLNENGVQAANWSQVKANGKVYHMPNPYSPTEAIVTLK